MILWMVCFGISRSFLTGDSVSLTRLIFIAVNGCRLREWRFKLPTYFSYTFVQPLHTSKGTIRLVTVFFDAFFSAAVPKVDFCLLALCSSVVPDMFQLPQVTYLTCYNSTSASNNNSYTVSILLLPTYIYNFHKTKARILPLQDVRFRWPSDCETLKHFSDSFHFTECWTYMG